MNPSRFLVLALLVAAPATCRAENCLRCAMPPQTLRQTAADSKFIVLVRPVNDPNNVNDHKTTFLVIRDALKDDPAIARRPLLRIPRIEINAKDPPSFVVFGDVFKGEIDVFRGIEGGPALAEYVRGLVSVTPKGNVEVLRYCFDHLNSAEAEVANDAYAEFMRASSADIGRAAPKLKPARLRRWLRDEKTPSRRLSLFALLLGACGERQDADLIRDVFDNQLKKGEFNDLDGFCVGRTLLDPADGWAAVRKLAERSDDFRLAHAALRSARFFRNEHPGVVAKKDLVAVVGLLFDQDQIADLAVEELRKWRCWDLTERVLALAEKEIASEAAAKLVRRAVLRYAIDCPDKRCKAHVAKERAKDPEGVKDVQDLLNLEDGRDPKLN
jgi:hypothetical protein